LKGRQASWDVAQTWKKLITNFNILVKSSDISSICVLMNSMALSSPNHCAIPRRRRSPKGTMMIRKDDIPELGMHFEHTFVRVEDGKYPRAQTPQNGPVYPSAQAESLPPRQETSFSQLNRVYASREADHSPSSRYFRDPLQ